MDFISLVLIAVGLSMDAFAVSVCKGMSVKELKPKHALLAGLYFGGFQFLMPVVGYFVGNRFSELVESVDHWVAFLLLCIIGINMIQEAFSKTKELSDDYGVKTMLLLAVATSIDALAVGISFAFLSVDIFVAAGLIGVITFLFSCAGVYIGRAFGLRFKSKAELAGGIILILIGLKILLEHLGILSF